MISNRYSSYCMTLLFILVFTFLVFDVVETQPCVNGKSRNFPCKGISLQAWVPLNKFSSKPIFASNIWGYVDLDDNREYAIIGLGNGTGVVDVTKPNKPRIVGIVRALNSRWREVKVYSYFNSKTKRWDAYAYITTEAGQGLQILDLSQLPNKVSLARTDKDVLTAHTAFVSNVDFATGVAIPGLTPYLYLEGSDRLFFNQSPKISLIDSSSKSLGRCGDGKCSSGTKSASCACATGCSCCLVPSANPGFNVFSLQNPKDPKLLGNYKLTYMHDVYIETFQGPRAAQCAPGHDPCEVVFGWTGTDFRIIDFTDKRSPKILSTLQYEGLGYPHSGWITKNKQWLISFDEFDELDSGRATRIMSINIGDLLNPRIIESYNGPTQAIEHNGYTVDHKLYVAHYTRGLTILDTKNPTKLKEVAFFDTHPENNSTEFSGAWGVYPFLPSGNILISDINRGLFILRQQ